MDQESEEIIDKFMLRWAEELSRIVEQATGEEATLGGTRAQASKESQSMAGCSWWKQNTTGKESFPIWVGADEATWSVVGATENGGDPQASFFEMVSRASQATLAALSAGFPEPLECGPGNLEAPPSRAELQLCKIRISFQGGELEPLFLLLETSAIRLLKPQGKDLASLNSALLERLMDLQLPVSVLLGRAVMKIKDVLKVTPGSVIELDRQIGDFVEVMVHGTVVAKGEIVSVKGNYGVRIKEVISRQDRLALHEAA